MKGPGAKCLGDPGVRVEKDSGYGSCMAKVLVGYATRAGSSADVAAIIADQLREGGHEVTLADLKDQPGVDAFDVVVAGSAIQMQAWLPEAMGWLRLRGPALREKRVAVFNVCMGATEADKPGKREESLGYNDSAKELVTPVAEESFAGRYTPEKVGLIARLLFKAQQKEPKDYIEPEKVRAWATSVVSDVAV